MPSWFQKIEATTFRAHFCTRKFLGRAEPLCRHSIDCCTVSGSLWYRRVSFMVTNRDRNIFRLPRKNSKRSSDDCYRWRFWSTFTHFGAHFAERKEKQFPRQETWQIKWILTEQTDCNLRNVRDVATT